jgi:adenylate cyclase
MERLHDLLTPPAVRSDRRWSVLIGLGCALLTGLLPLTDLMERIELRSHDLRFHLRFQWRGPRRTKAHVVIIAIDDDTLQAWQEPMVFWGTHYATVIRRAREAGAAWIGMDVIQATDADRYAPNGARPTIDLARALQEARGRVVLSNVQSIDGPPVNPAAPLVMLEETAENIGFVNLPPQTDEQVRTASLFLRDRAGILPSFVGLLAARALGFAPQDERALRSLAGYAGDDPDAPVFWVNYTGRPFPVIPADRLAAGGLTEVERQTLDGAILLVGTTYRLSNDRYQLPPRGFENGVQLQAQALSTLLDGVSLRRGARRQEALLTAILACLMLVSTLRYAPGRGLAMVGVAGAAWCGGAFIAFDRGNTLLPIVAPLCGFALPWLAFHCARSLEEGVRRLEVEAVFGRYVSSEIRDFLLSDPAHRQLGGLERNATVLFVDIRGFTAYAQTRAPAAVMGELNALFGEMAPIIDRQSGLLYKYTGDGLLAVFGVPRPLENHAQAALNAAQEMATTVRRINAERAKAHLPPWRIGCGLHSGPVVYGNLGVAARSEFTVIGDTVNLASRLQALNKQWNSDIVLSGETYQQLTAPPAACVAQECEIDGRTGPVLTYRL